MSLGTMENYYDSDSHDNFVDLDPGIFFNADPDPVKFLLI